MAKAHGVSSATVQRIWDARGLQPHRVETFKLSRKLSRDPKFVETLTDKRIRRGAFGGVPELAAAIEEYLETYNETGKPFVWTAKIDAILAKAAKCKAILETVH